MQYCVYLLSTIIPRECSDLTWRYICPLLHSAAVYAVPSAMLRQGNAGRFTEVVSCGSRPCGVCCCPPSGHLFRVVVSVGGQWDVVSMTIEEAPGWRKGFGAGRDRDHRPRQALLVTVWLNSFIDLLRTPCPVAHLHWQTAQCVGVCQLQLTTLNNPPHGLFLCSVYSIHTWDENRAGSSENRMPMFFGVVGTQKACRESLSVS